MAIRKRAAKVKGKGKSKILAPTPPTFVESPQLSDLMKVINKQHSTHTVMRGDNPMPTRRQKTGILSVDMCLGGGWRYASGSMVIGERSAGKSTIALMTIAQALKDNPDKVAVWIDLEGTLDTVWAKKLGVDTERVYIVSPDSGEEAIDLAIAFMGAEQTCMIVTDSIAAIVPMKEVEASAETAFMALHARLIGGYVRRVNNALIRERKKGHDLIVMHLNQFRIDITKMFGDKRVVPGGRALEFSTSQQMTIVNKEHKAEKGDNAGTVLFNEHSFVITKDKTGGRLKEGKFKLIRDAEAGFPEGYIDQSKFMMAAGQRIGLYTGGGSSHKLDGCGTFKSHAEVANYFFENPNKLEEFNSRILLEYRKLWALE
jgi:recombination protein RecA